MPYIGNQPYQGIIDSGNIVDGSIQTGDLANSAVTTAKIADSNITSAKIADTGVTVAKLNSDVTQLIAQGGGPKITGVAITNSSWTTIDDTAVDTAGGYVKLTGTNFVTGCSVVVGTTSATAVTFTSSTELRVQLPAQAAGTYILYVTNPDGGTAIRVNAVTYSATPSWVTSSTLPQQDDGVAISIQLNATSATTYALQAGSTLPSGLTLTSGGLLSGTVSGLTNDTSYSFTVVATDAELQDSPRAFTVNIAASDTYFNLTTLLINGDTAPNVLTDASSNNFNLTAYGDARASNFTPYATGWSNYFDGSGDCLSIASNGVFSFGTDDFTIECWLYSTDSASDDGVIVVGDQAAKVGISSTGTTIKFRYNTGLDLITKTNVTINQWHHVAITRNNGVGYLYVDGISAGSAALTTNFSQDKVIIGSWTVSPTISYEFTGFISNVRIVKGLAVYTGNFTTPTQPLTVTQSSDTNISAITGTQTSLLTCHANRIVDGSANNLTITRNGDVAVRSFNPFNITNTGTSGSVYFDGTGDYLTVASTAELAVGAGQFCVEFWIYPVGSWATSNAVLVAGETNGIWIGVSTGNFVLRAYNVADFLSTGTLPALNTWTHVAICRNSSNTASMYFNGTRVATGTVTQNFAQFTTYIATDGAGAGLQASYISNLRMVKGAAVYDPTQTTIALPTTPLTAIANTSLLTLQNKQPHNNHGFQDSSTNNHLITRNGNTTQGTFSPFSQTGWGNYFNGSSYLSCGSSAFVFPGDFTIECWIYPTSLPSNKCICSSQVSPSASGFDLGYNSSGQLYIYSNSFLGTSTNTLTVNTWNHVAFVRNGSSSGNCVFYINGVVAGSFTSTTSFTSTSNFIGTNGFDSTTRPIAYLSNFRSVIGRAVYTGAFTPPITPLTRTTGGTNPPQGTECSLLTCQSNRFLDSNGVNVPASSPLTITATGSPSVVAFSPFSPTASWSAATYGGSGYFDGSGDYLTFPSNATFAFGTGDFTVEFWVNEANWSPLGGTNYAHWISIDSYTTGVMIRPNLTGSAIQVFVGNTLYSFSISLSLNTWYHIALSRSSSSMRLFVNGTQVGSTQTVSYNISTNTSNTIGTAVHSYSEVMQGYLSDVRIVSGTAVYTSDFTPPTAPLTAITNTSLLLNFTDAAVRDSSGRLVLETVNDSKVSTVQKKYGTGAMYFDGTGDYNFIPSSPALGLSGDFTIESWIYLTANPVESSGAYLTDFRTSSTLSNWAIGLIGNTGTKMYAYTNNGSLSIVGTSVVPLNSWQHLAYVRAGTSVTLYLNGVACGTGSTNYIQGPTSVTIGSRYTGGQEYITGYVDDFRITRYARYTGSSTSTPNFTPPAQTFKLR